jgi:carboxymethylenebutenolidase
MAGRDITITADDGGKFSAYLALPAAGKGPGLLMLQEIFGVNREMRETADLYAEEGYVVLVPDMFWRLQPGLQLGYTPEDVQKGRDLKAKTDLDVAARDMSAAVRALKGMPEVTGKVGAIGYCFGGLLAYLAAARCGVDAAASYYGGGIDNHLSEAGKTCPIVFHFAGEDAGIPMSAVEKIKAAFAGRRDAQVHVYPGVQHAFANHGRPSFDKPATGVAHTRSVALFRDIMGPRYDLVALWEKHCEYEFGTRDVDATMATMVAEPYVNHIPTMTGGVGYKNLHRFYKNHFIPKTPKDTRLVPISRTVGSDRVVDEMLFCFTHDIEIDWMLPGVAPTGKYVEVPLVAIVCFRGDKLYNEHIYWDQASVLVQIGLLDPKLHPVAGIETAKKLVDKTLPSNTLMRRWPESDPTGSAPTGKAAE